jgi:hypothetical protein
MRIARVVLLVLLCLPLTAAAQQEPAVPPEPPVAAEEQVLPPLLVTAPPPISASSEMLIPGKDFELMPQGRPADILRLIPGLSIAQHQGGGKAEQYFLRGFDEDHGTDIALFVDGLPVNLRSHAHGQGYADLHFLIPETVKLVEGFKGPYFVEFGDFATSGAVNFVLRDYVEENVFEVAGGSWNTQRLLAMMSPTRDALKTLVALDFYYSDGPFDNPNNYFRFNGLARATATLAEDMTLSLWASHYRGDWHGSGEIPARAVREGLIDRFGSIDPSEGGQTQRTNLNADYRWKISDSQALRAHAYFSYYELNLFNDFTFFLTDPINGDEIHQRDRRALGGFDLDYQHHGTPLGMSLTTTGGFQYRVDAARVILGTATQRHPTGRTQDVDVVEQSYSPYLKFDLVPLNWLRLVTGARGDIFNYDVGQNVNLAGGDLNGDVTRARPNVKANLILGPWYETELFANFGTGFHSNDARAVIADPSLEALPTATGHEFGVRTRILPRTQVAATYWWLDLDSELVFVGDEGTTEARGPSRREGFEFDTRVQLLDWLTFSGDFTYTTRAEFENGDAIPLAPLWTARADLTARLPWGLAASFQMRHLGDRYASEDREQTARGYTLFDVIGRYRYKNLEAFLTIENLFDVDWREAQFYFESRLPHEPAEGVADIHFTPGNPRTLLGGLTLRF